MSTDDTTTTGRREAWPDLDATKAIALPSGYTIHVRQELEAESYYVLGDILVEMAELSGNSSREARVKRRDLNREVVLLWVTHWDIRPRDASATDAPMPMSDEALRMLDYHVITEIDDAVGEHQRPYVAEVVQILSGAPKGKATAVAAGTGGGTSSASASVPTPRPTTSRAGRRAGTR